MVVLQKDKYTNKVISVYDNIKQLSEITKLTGVDAGSIVQAWLGERRTAGGFAWNITDYEVRTDEAWEFYGENAKNRYYVSHKGNIKSVSKKSKLELELKAEIDSDGYRRHPLHTNNAKRIGRLVATLFLREPKEDETVDHINGNTQDDKVTNLRWLPRSENSKLKQGNFGWAQFDRDDNLIATYKSGGEVQRYLGLSDTQLFDTRLKDGIYKDYKWVKFPIKHSKVEHTITKQFDFDYGHRVWNQELDSELSCNSFCKCTHLHGHLGSVIVEIASCRLTGGMVLDFTNLKFFKKWIDDTLDHKFIIDINDPRFNQITGMLDEDVEWITNNYGVVNSTDVIKESFVVVKFVPTSENLAQFLYSELSDKLAGVETVSVSAVTFKEGPNTSATFREEK